MNPIKELLYRIRDKYIATKLTRQTTKLDGKIGYID